MASDTGGRVLVFDCNSVDDLVGREMGGWGVGVACVSSLSV